jgi:3-methyladenine DNA glycosylase AlkD
MLITKIKKELRQQASPEKAAILQRFFKTGPGQYGTGDKFLGVVMPDQRIIAKKYYTLIDLKEVEELLQSQYHEDRMLALIMLVLKYGKATEGEQTKIYQLYLKNTKWINNWDLVDVTTPQIVGAYSFQHDRQLVYKLVKSKNLWERRIAVLATFYYIRQDEIKDTLALAKLLLKDDHDLMHKAVGWMLREAGKVDQKALLGFLDEFAPQMPRTMLRYAIEKLTDRQKKKYLAIKKVI